MPAPGCTGGSLSNPPPDGTSLDTARAMVLALQEELDVSRQRIRSLEAQLARVRSTPNYPQSGSARLDMLGDADLFFRTLGQHVVCGVFVYDLVSGQNVYVNPRYTELLGYTLADLDALDHAAFAALFHPDDRENVYAHMAEVGRSDGDTPRSVEYRFQHKDGGWVWCRSYDVAFTRGPDGEMRRLMGSLVDITDVMEAKEAQAQFARMAAHDLRAPTRRIRQYVELLGEELEGSLSVDARTVLSAIDQQADRMLALVTGIRRLTGMVPPTDREFVAVHDIVDRVLEAVPHEWKGRAVLVHRDDLPVLPLFPDLVQVLYAHLLANALRYGDDKRLVVQFTMERVGGTVVLGLRNNGPPMAADLADTVFVPFRRGRGRDGGVGLGLPICKRVVDCHHGRIWIEREPDHTHVRFTLARGAA